MAEIEKRRVELDGAGTRNTISTEGGELSAVCFQVYHVSDAPGNVTPKMVPS